MGTSVSSWGSNSLGWRYLSYDSMEPSEETVNDSWAATDSPLTLVSTVHPYLASGSLSL